MGNMDGVTAAAASATACPAPPSCSSPRTPSATSCSAAARPARADTCSRRRATTRSCAPSTASSRGEDFIDPALAPSLLELSRESLITGREREILQLLADGMSNADVAQKLFISQETVKSHVRHILAKLEADNRTQAVAIALRESIIE